MKVYELIQELAKYPPDMQVATTVIAERIEPLNKHEDGTVDIDSFKLGPALCVLPTTAGGFYCVRIEVEL